MSINVKFGATDAGFSSTVSKVNNSLKGLDNNVKGVSGSVNASFSSMAKEGAALAVGFGAIKGAFNLVSGTFDNFKAALDMGGELSDLSARTGETAGNLTILQRAFDNTGAGADKVGPSLNKLQRAIVEAGQGNQTAADAFGRLGLSFDELKYKSPIDQMKAVADGLKGLPNDSERAATAMQIFGRSGGELLPMFMSMSEEIATAKSELGSLPDVMDRNASAFDAISDKLTVVKGKMTEFAAGMLQSLLPALNKVINAGSELDSAGFGQQIGKKLSEAFTLITSGDMWEIFTERGIAAVNAIRSSGVINGLAAAINATLDFGLREDLGGSQDWKGSFDKYKKAGIDANVEIADALDARVEAMMKKHSDAAAAAVAQMQAEMDEAAANSGIMLKDIREAAKETTEIPKWLERGAQEATKAKKELSAGEQNARNIAVLFGDASDNAAQITKELALSEQLAQRIKAAMKEDDATDKGRLNEKAEKAMNEGNFSAAKRAQRQIARREQDAEIRGVGKGRDNRNIQDIAKEEGINPFRKTSKQLRDEILEKRGQKQDGGKGGAAADKGNGKAGDGKADKPDTLTKIVTDIKGILEKLEKKLPQTALAN